MVKLRMTARVSRVFVWPRLAIMLLILKHMKNPFHMRLITFLTKSSSLTLPSLMASFLSTDFNT